jgi:hypothetical protein
LIIISTHEKFPQDILKKRKVQKIKFKINKNATPLIKAKNQWGSGNFILDSIK